ncbi:outer membrane beta-barrel protein [Bradyrhizobium sp. ARR65]|uniref:outer membrane beta-barrel protein n=1 Tax=Bradyrhizobium sp. ARR65 TaxID=1040989 RepID=UPI000465C4D3|nr:outer membrane beta-barrel protein [Bradyrhizobium sp. ARR65]
MKRIPLTTVALGALALGTPAFAADLAVKAPLRAPLIYDWSGFYVGGFGGYGFGNQNVNNATGPAGFADFTANFESHGPFGGGEIGYNWQSGNLVFGVEVDGAGTNIQGNDNFALGWNDANKLSWVASLRARGGITVDRLLLFFTGGWATGDIEHTNTNPGAGVDQFTAHRSGLAAGGGLAYAIRDNLIGKFEYRYYDLGTYHRDAPTNGVLPYNVANTYSTVLLGLDFKFGGGPAFAKY